MAMLRLRRGILPTGMFDISTPFDTSSMITDVFDSTATPTGLARPSQYIPTGGLPMQNANAAGAVAVSKEMMVAGMVSAVFYALF